MRPVGWASEGRQGPRHRPGPLRAPRRTTWQSRATRGYRVLLRSQRLHKYAGRRVPAGEVANWLSRDAVKLPSVETRRGPNDPVRNGSLFAGTSLARSTGDRRCGHRRYGLFELGGERLSCGGGWGSRRPARLAVLEVGLEPFGLVHRPVTGSCTQDGRPRRVSSIPSTSTGSGSAWRMESWQERPGVTRRS